MSNGGDLKISGDQLNGRTKEFLDELKAIDKVSCRQFVSCRALRTDGESAGNNPSERR